MVALKEAATHTRGWGRAARALAVAETAPPEPPALGSGNLAGGGTSSTKSLPSCSCEAPLLLLSEREPAEPSL